MPLTHYKLTLDGTAQQLSRVLPAADRSTGGKNDVACSVITLQPKGANANIVLIGGPTVDATNFAFSLPAGSGGVPPAPLILAPSLGPPLRLSGLYAIGTPNEVLQIGVLDF